MLLNRSALESITRGAFSAVALIVCCLLMLKLSINICLFFQGEYNADLNRIIFGNTDWSDPCRYESHFEFPNYGMDEIQKIIDESELTWLCDDSTR